MEKIRLTSWYGKYSIIYRVSYMSGGAGFLPSTVAMEKTNHEWVDVSHVILLLKMLIFHWNVSLLEGTASKITIFLMFFWEYKMSLLPMSFLSFKNE